jgi:hypothetical protein
MGEMVGDQTANQAAKPLKKGGKKKEKKIITSSGTLELQAVLVVLLLLLHPVLSVSLRHIWSPLVEALRGSLVVRLSGKPVELGPGSAGGVDNPVEQSRSSAGLRGGDLAGWLFFYYIMVVWRSLP